MSFRNRVPHSSCQLWTASTCPSRNVWASSVHPLVDSAVYEGGAVLAGARLLSPWWEGAAGLSHLRRVFISPGIGVVFCLGSRGMWPPPLWAELASVSLPLKLPASPPGDGPLMSLCQSSCLFPAISPAKTLELASTAQTQEEQQDHFPQTEATARK